MMQAVNKSNPWLRWQTHHLTKWCFFLSAMEETRKMLHLDHSFIWWWNFNASENSSEIPWKFWNVVWRWWFWLIMWKMMKYSGIAIYRFDIDRFSACTVRNFWSRIKFHINNGIYFRIHRSPNYRFSALIICKSRSRRGIFRMDRLKKKLKQSIY